MNYFVYTHLDLHWIKPVDNEWLLKLELFTAAAKHLEKSYHMSCIFIIKWTDVNDFPRCLIIFTIAFSRSCKGNFEAYIYNNK